MYRRRLVRKKRRKEFDEDRDSITSNGNEQIPLRLTPNESTYARDQFIPTEIICEEDNDSVISNECIGASDHDGDTSSTTIQPQVQDIWPAPDILSGFHALPEYQEVASILEKGYLKDIHLSKERTRAAVLILSWTGNSKQLDALLQMGVSTEVPDIEGRFPLHLAASVGSTASVYVLLRHGAEVNVYDRSGLITPLHCAAAAASLECLTLLLNAGANIEAGVTTTGNGKSPLYYAVQSNSLACVSKLLNHGAAVNMSQVYTETPLHVAANLGYAECLQTLLDAGADFRVTSGLIKSTPLHLAAEDGNAACTKLLLDAGADINKRNKKNQTPLHLAALAQSAKTVELLLQRKADPNAIDIDHRTPLHSAIVKGSRSCECVKLLLQNGARVNASDLFGYTPVHIAALNDCCSCLRLLLDNGGDVTKKTKGNVSALSFITRRTPEIIKYLETKLDLGIKQLDYELGDMDCELQLDFRILVPDLRSGETKLLSTFVEVGQRRLLRHPLVGTFLYLKWLRIRKYFIMSLFGHATYVFLCSAYILNVVLNETEELSTGFVGLNIVILLFTIISLCKELFQIAHIRRGYILHWENWLQWSIIITMFIVLVPRSWSPAFAVIKHHISVFGIFFNWIELMVIMGRFPMFGIYVQMFTTGAVNFSKFLLAYCCLLIAFAFSFRMTFPNYNAFQDISASVVKTIVMMTGELEFEDIFFPDNEQRSLILVNRNVPYPGTAHLFFLLFLVVVTIVLTNLLVGLSVSDIQGLQRSAGLERLVRQVQLIAYMESILFSKLWDWLPISILAFFRRNAILLASPSRRILTIRPNDPRDCRVPKELAAAVFKNVAERRDRRRRGQLIEKNYQCCVKECECNGFSDLP